MKVVIVSGGFDPIHSGHIDYLNSAKNLGNELWVGVNSDQWLINKKGNYFMPYKERYSIITNLKCVDNVIPIANDHLSSSAIGAIEYIVKKFDSTTIHLKTKADSDADPVSDKKSSDSVEKMAKRATAKRK